MTIIATSRPRTAAEFVVHQLRRKILSGEISAGERLRQNHIASEFGVSSTPVREALRELAAEGLIVSDAHRGNMVRGLTISDVSEIYELRRKLEPVLIERTFPSVTPDDLDECAALIETMEKTSDIVSWSQMNGQFHTLLSGPDQELRTARLVESLRDASAPYVALSLYGRDTELARSNDDHRNIVAAYRQQDLAQTIRLNDLHLQATIEIIREKFSAPEG